MTVCVAALCCSETMAVVASDRIITAGPPMNLEFEHDIKKIDVLRDRFLFMTAGEALVGTGLLGRVDAELVQQTHADVSDVGEAVVRAYTSIRSNAIEEHVFRPFNYSCASFIAEGQKQLPPQVYMQIFQALQQFNLGMEMIFVGMADGRARIGFIFHPGILRWYDRLGFHAIGSGAIHAAMSLVGHSATSSLEETAFRVYAAKRRAEVAPGVGRETDMMVVSNDGVREFNSTAFEELDKVYACTMTRSECDLTKVKEALNEG